MSLFSRIVHSVLLFSTPTFAYSTSEIPAFIVKPAHSPLQIPDLRTLSYDEVLDLLKSIESDSFEERYSEDELNQINEFISLLAIEGATEDEKPAIEYAASCLFRKDDIQYANLTSKDGYYLKPAIYQEGARDFVLCKSWFKKQWDQTRAFVKKHKKAIIIGAIVVVAVAVVVVAAVAISSTAAGAAAAGAAGAAAGADNSTPKGSGHLEAKETPSTDSLASSLSTQVSEFKETIAQEQFAAALESNGISMEENGRIIGSSFTHKAVDSLTQNPPLARELKDLGFNSDYPIPSWLQTYSESPTIMPHPTADLAFSTDYSTSYGTNYDDLNSFVYQARGDLALNTECYTQAVQDFGSAISLNPNNPTLYLERGIANFELGNYEESIADYNQFVEKTAEPLSVTDLSLGFAEGVTKGAYESARGPFSSCPSL